MINIDLSDSQWNLILDLLQEARGVETNIIRKNVIEITIEVFMEAGK